MILLDRVSGSFEQNLSPECNYIYKFISDVYFNHELNPQNPFLNINLGRRMGHTTAVKYFIRNNPDLKICVFVESENLVKDYSEFKSNPNVSIFNKNTQAIRGKLFDYLIFDSCSTPLSNFLNSYRLFYNIPSVFVGSFALL